jgi:hypothetical protein
MILPLNHFSQPAAPSILPSPHNMMPNFVTGLKTTSFAQRQAFSNKPSSQSKEDGTDGKKPKIPKFVAKTVSLFRKPAGDKAK